jgi:hypothetical protein
LGSAGKKKGRRNPSTLPCARALPCAARYNT